jgi:2,4-dienoyl-CoA reductase-like NADH-dependent reductase (Old Yellow Enzyme family)
VTEQSRLFEPVTLGPLTLPNRVGVAPMTRVSGTPEGVPTEQMIRYYTKFARGGFGLIITEGAYPDEKHSQGYFNQPGIINEEQVQGWKKITESVHNHGAKFIMQLMHAGALSQGNRLTKERLAPSAVQPKGEQAELYFGSGKFPTPRAATLDDIRAVIDGFVTSAKLAKAAGFDGVEIHGANGYLLDQFLTEYTNNRDDDYGGSTVNRVRLPAEIAMAVRDAVGPRFCVGIRISQSKINDYEYKWSGEEQDAAIIFGGLSEAGLDYIHTTEYEAWVPTYADDGPTKATEPAFGEHGRTLAGLAKRYGQLPVIANGGLHVPERAERIIADGAADVITLGRGALANSDWPNRVKGGRPLDEFQPERTLHLTAQIKEFEAPPL